MTSVLNNPYVKLKIPKSQQNIFQALAVDLCSKANVNYNADIKLDFNRFANLEFTTLQTLIKRLLINYKPFAGKFQAASVVKRKVSLKQVITKFRSLDTNSALIGFTASKDLIYLTKINNRIALFGDIDSELINFSLIKSNISGEWGLNVVKPGSNNDTEWVLNIATTGLYTQDIESHILALYNNKLTCESHGYNKCIAYDLIKTNKLNPGQYTFFADEDDTTKVSLDAVPLKVGTVTDNSLTDPDYSYKKYSDVDDQVKFMTNLVNELVYDERDKRDARKLLNKIKATEHKLARGTLFTQLDDILKRYTNSHFIVLTDMEEILGQVLYNDPPSGWGQKDIDATIKRNKPVFAKLKCGEKAILDAITNQRWDDVIDLLCENHGGTNKVDQKLQTLLDNSSVYMAIPCSILTDSLDKEVIPYYTAIYEESSSKYLSYTYMERRLDTDVNKHKASLTNLLSFPKYGYLGTKDYPFSSAVTMINYGSVLVEFKEIIKERSTLCIGDSIDKTISPPTEFDKLSIHHFLGVLISYPNMHYSMALDNNYIKEFVLLLDNIMSSESLHYGLDSNYLMRNIEEYMESYFEVQIKGDLVFNERDIKAIYVNNTEDATSMAKALRKDKLNIPLKYSQQIPEEYLNALATLDIRQGNKHFTSMVV